MLEQNGGMKGGNTMKEEGPGDHPLYLIYINDFPFEMMHCFVSVSMPMCSLKGCYFTKSVQSWSCLNFFSFLFLKSLAIVSTVEI